MGSEAHPYQRLRESVLPAADAILRSVPPERVPGRDGPLYAAYTLDGRTPETRGKPAEHAATFEADPVTVGAALQRHGFEPGHLAALKYHPETGETDDGNLIWRESRLSMWQLHVHLFGVDGETEAHAHYERSGLRAPVRHYNGEGYDIPEGRKRFSMLLGRFLDLPEWRLSEWSAEQGRGDA